MAKPTFYFLSWSSIKKNTGTINFCEGTFGLHSRQWAIIRQRPFYYYEFRFSQKILKSVISFKYVIGEFSDAKKKILSVFFFFRSVSRRILYRQDKIFFFALIDTFGHHNKTIIELQTLRLD